MNRLSPHRLWSKVLNSHPAIKSSYLILLIIIGIGLGLRIHGLSESLWFDEVYRTHLILNHDNITKLLFHDVHNFLYNGFMYAWINVFGDSEVSIRLPSLLFGLASALLFYTWIASNFNTAIALQTFAWLMLSPFIIWYSTEAKNNILVVFFTIVILITYGRLFEQGGYRSYLLAVLAGVGGIFTDFLLFLPLFAVFMWACVESLRSVSRLGLKRVSIVICTTLLLTAPLIIFKYRFRHELVRGYMKSLNPEELFLLLFNFLPSGNAILKLNPYGGFSGLDRLWHILLLASMSILVGILLIIGLYRLAKTREGFLVDCMFALPVVALCLLTGVVAKITGVEQKIYLERNLSSVIIIPFSLILVYGANSFSKRSLRTAAATLLFVITISSSALMLTVNRDAWTVYKPNPDWRAFALDARADSPTTVFTSCPVAAPAYYLRDSNIKVVQFATNQLNHRNVRLYIISNLVRRGGASQSEHFYVAVNRFWGSDLIQKLRDARINDYFQLLKQEDYSGLTVFKYTVR